MKTNRMYFSEEMVNNGELYSFLKTLVSIAHSSDLTYDIHLYAEDFNAFILEWVQVPWDRSYGGRFEYVDEDQIVMREYISPDNSIMYFENDEEFREYVESEYLKDKE